MSKNLTQLSKFLSMGLRHDDKVLKVSVDEEGWAPVKDILSNNKEFTMETLQSIVNSDNKGRYSFSEDNTKIRANQGHTMTKVNINFKECIPPRFLYHGTSSRFVSDILSKGLLPMNRLYVHLSADSETAYTVGKRHGGDTVILVIDSEAAYHNGVKFYLSDNGVWLTKKVNNTFILTHTKESNNDKF